MSGAGAMIDVRALGYVVIEATDLERWERFATRVIGLRPVESPDPDGERRYAMDAYGYRFRVVRGGRDRFACAGWEVPGPAAFAAALQALEGVGVRCRREDAAAAALRGVRELAAFTAPGGLPCEIFHGMPLDYAPLASPAGVPAFVTGYHGDMGLGHIAAATPDLPAAHAFFTGVMGFGQTDYMHLRLSPDPADPGQGLHFLHCNNPRHHSLALFQDANPHPGELVHLMVEVPDIDALGAFMDRVHAEGVRVVTSLGRHTNDRMVSMYVETPAGFMLEYGFGGVQVDWSRYLPTESARTSHWGHRWGQG